MDPAVQKQRLDAFVKETGAEPEIAAHYLEFQKWNVEAAVRGFRAMKVEEAKYKSQSKEELSKDEVSRKDSGGGRNGKLSRGFSMANTELVANVRTYIKEHEKQGSESEFELFEDTPNHSFILPNITKESKEYIDFLKNDLIDKHTYISLMEAGQLNWWAEKGLCRKLFPLSTVGDGNCLLHAASLGMWGFHDRLLTLREALYRTLTSPTTNAALQRRWKYAQWQLNMRVGGLTFSRKEWDEEWSEIVRLAYHRPRSTSEKPNRRISRQFTLASSPMRESSERTFADECDSFESLEEFHVFVLAHVLRRPIIVVADIFLKDIQGQPLAPIPFRGIYLPLEINPDQCYKFPLVLAYNAGHFAALVPAEGEEANKDGAFLSSSIPLVGKDFELLPIHYLTDPGKAWDLEEDDKLKREATDISHEEKIGLLIDYLDVVRVSQLEKKESALAKLAHSKQPYKLAVSESHLKKKELKGGSIKIKDKKPDKSAMLSRALQSVSNLFVSSANGAVISAKLDTIHKPSFYGEMIANYMVAAEKRFQQGKGEHVAEVKEPKSEARHCLSPGCTLYGTPEQNYMCSGCYKSQQQSANQIIRGSPGKTHSAAQYVDVQRSSTAPDLLTKHDIVELQRQGSESAVGTHSSGNTRWFSVPVNISGHVLASQNITGGDASGQNLSGDSRAGPTVSGHTPSGERHERVLSGTPKREGVGVQSPTRDLIRWPCESPNCKFFGSEDYNGYCRSCFDRQQFEQMTDSGML